MDPKEERASLPGDNAELRDALQKFFLGNPDDLDRLAAEQNLNLEYMSRMNEVALRGAHNLVSRQKAVLRETFDELVMIMKDAASIVENPAATESYLLSVERSIVRGLKHLRIAFEWANEMNLATVETLEERLGKVRSDVRAERAGPRGGNE